MLIVHPSHLSPVLQCSNLDVLRGIEKENLEPRKRDEIRCLALRVPPNTENGVHVRSGISSIEDYGPGSQAKAIFKSLSTLSPCCRLSVIHTSDWELV